VVEYPAEGGTLLQVNSSGWPEAAEKNSEGIRYDANCSVPCATEKILCQQPGKSYNNNF
jgi:hypothetical protein